MGRVVISKLGENGIGYSRNTDILSGAYGIHERLTGVDAYFLEEFWGGNIDGFRGLNGSVQD